MLKTFLFILSLSCGPLQSAEKSMTKKDDAEVYGKVSSDSTLDKMLQVPGVEAIYEKCKTDNPNFSENIPTCIWDAVKVKPDLKKKVMQVYDDSLKNQKAGRSPASTKSTSFTDRKLAVTTDYSSDPGVQALSDYFGTKLAEILDTKEEDAKKGLIVTVDHGKFIELYKSELGKSIVNALTSYCLNTELDTLCKEKGYCKYNPDQKQINIDSLKTAKFTSDSDDADRWNKCITGVPKVCYENVVNNQESKTQACLVMDFIKSARKNLISSEEQKKFYDDLGKKTIGVQSNFKVIDGDKATNDSLTQITSQDMEKEYTNAKGEKTSIKEVNEQLAKEASECVDNNQVKADKCKKFINTNKEENEKALAEFGMRQEIQKEKLDEELKDQSSVASYLQEEGYDKDQIAKMTDATNLDKTKDEIKKRFEAEKNAFIATMKEKIKGKTSNDEGQISSSDETQLTRIKNIFSNRTQDLSSLIKFNNIVSSYLTVKDTKTKEQSRNTASLFAEIESLKGKDAEEMKKRLENAKLKDKKNDLEFKIKDINNVLKYKTQPDEPEKP